MSPLVLALVTAVVVQPTAPVVSPASATAVDAARTWLEALQHVELNTLQGLTVFPFRFDLTWQARRVTRPPGDDKNWVRVRHGTDPCSRVTRRASAFEKWLECMTRESASVVSALRRTSSPSFSIALAEGRRAADKRLSFRVRRSGIEGSWVSGTLTAGEHESYTFLVAVDDHDPSARRVRAVFVWATYASEVRKPQLVEPDVAPVN